MQSYLFVPATQPDRYLKARESGADAVIIDLEDAVAPHEKNLARDHLREALKSDRNFLVRINSQGTEWFEDDLRLIRSCAPRGIIIPKIESASLIETVILKEIPARTLLFPLIESAEGMNNCQTIARAKQVKALIFGTLDFQLDLNLKLSNESLNPFRLALTLASRLANISPPIDGVCTDIHNTRELEAQLASAIAVGFSGKLCIHPTQVPATRRAFSPTESDRAWAQEILEAAASSGGAVIAFKGQMIDKPIIQRAEQIMGITLEENTKDK
ncbi:MAG: CoA ester lyase [Planctomycetota bacterium]|nr:MAG: CoA ester lyase [Planctomycetota bacterium]